MSSILKYILLIFTLYLVGASAYADSVCSVKNGGVLDSMVSQFANVASNWQNQINPIAKRIFYILFAMEFMWQLAVQKVFAGDIEKLWVFFFTRSVLCFFFARYLVDVKLYQQIIEYFASLASRLSNFSLSLTPGNNFATMGPSEVIGHFACIADSIHQVSDTTGALQYMTLKFSLAIMQVLLLVVLSFIAFYLIKVLLQAYFLLYAGFILTGFAGSSWTMPFWQRYVQAISGIAIKFLAVCFLLGILTTQMKGWTVDINAATNIRDLSSVILKVLGSSIIIALLSHELPEWAASTLSGNLNMRFTSQMSSVANAMSGLGK